MRELSKCAFSLDDPHLQMTGLVFHLILDAFSVEGERIARTLRAVNSLRFAAATSSDPFLQRHEECLPKSGVRSCLFDTSNKGGRKNRAERGSFFRKPVKESQWQTSSTVATARTGDGHRPQGDLHPRCLQDGSALSVAKFFHGPGSRAVERGFDRVWT